MEGVKKWLPEDDILSNDVARIRIRLHINRFMLPPSPNTITLQKVVLSVSGQFHSSTSIKLLDVNIKFINVLKKYPVDFKLNWIVRDREKWRRVEMQRERNIVSACCKPWIQTDIFKVLKKYHFIFGVVTEKSNMLMSRDWKEVVADFRLI